MPHTYEEVRQIAYELPQEQRIQLANSLWESVDTERHEEADENVEAAWKAEVDRRVSEDEAGIGTDLSWEEVVQPLRAQLGK